jgi:replicative DNA helicase
MTTQTKISPHTTAEKYLLVINKGAPYREVKPHMDAMGGFYNGSGWYVEHKHKDNVSLLCQNASLKFFELPLIESSFEEFRKRHKSSYLIGKRNEIEFEIIKLREENNIPYDLNISELLSDESKGRLETFSKGKKLLDLLEESKKLDDGIRRAEEEEKLSKLSLSKSVDILPYTLDDFHKEITQKKEGLLTGYKELDEMVRIHNEAITLVAGRPSHGKTTFMLNLFLNLIEKYPEQHFYFFSYEETRLQVALKIINILSGWLFNEAQNLIQLEGYIKHRILEPHSKSVFGMVEDGKKKYQELVESGRLIIVGEAYHVDQLSSIIASLKSKLPLGAVFIDYIQKIKNKQKFGTRQLELADTSNIILETAKGCSIPIILGAQLGRDKDSKGKVRLDNLREAGDLEQDANLVLGLLNPAMEKAQEDQSPLTNRKVDLNVTPLKNRNGPVNKTITLEFDRPLLQIKDKK